MTTFHNQVDEQSEQQGPSKPVFFVIAALTFGFAALFFYVLIVKIGVEPIVTMATQVVESVSE